MQKTFPMFGQLFGRVRPAAPPLDATCMLCGSDNVGLAAHKNGYDVARCQDWRFMFVHPMPRQSELDALYRNESGARARRPSKRRPRACAGRGGA